LSFRAELEEIIEHIDSLPDAVGRVAEPSLQSALSEIGHPQSAVATLIKPADSNAAVLQYLRKMPRQRDASSAIDRTPSAQE